MGRGKLKTIKVTINKRKKSRRRRERKLNHRRKKWKRKSNVKREAERGKEWKNRILRASFPTAQLHLSTNQLQLSYSVAYHHDFITSNVIN